jgi:hypothetical protein
MEISLIINQLESLSMEFVEPLIPQIITISKSRISDKELRLLCIHIYTDIFLFNKNIVATNFEEFMLIMKFAIEYCKIPNSINVSI